MAILQVVEIVFAPVKTVDEIESVQRFEAASIELEDVRFLWLEVSTREEMQECHGEVFVITPLEVINMIETCSTAALDLK